MLFRSCFQAIGQFGTHSGLRKQPRRFVEDQHGLVFMQDHKRALRGPIGRVADYGALFGLRGHGEVRITLAMTPHPITPQHFDALHQLNQDHAVELSSLTPATFQNMIISASYTRCVDDGALLIAFDQDNDYDSPNFQWFRARYARFIYVDRVVVSPERRGEGLARLLYDDLFAFARRAGHERIVAEVNSDPPNPGSDAFHAAMGFGTVGEARLADRGKSVRYIARALAP